MDSTYPEATATLVAIADGTTSLYLSRGGGIIGGGAHGKVAQQAAQLLNVAEGHLDGLVDSGERGLPGSGRVRLTALTYEGQRSAEAAEDDLGHGRHPLSEVFHAAHAVISELRELDEAASRDLPEDPGPQGVTALMALAHAGDEAGIRSLAPTPAAIDGQDDLGYTALMYATNAGHEGVVRVLIDFGANPDATDRQGSTPLMFAAQHGHLAIVRHLLAAGADSNARGDHGLTPLGFAQQNGHQQTVALLIGAGAH